MNSIIIFAICTILLIKGLILDISDEKVLSAINIALSELTNLSDSGIYKSLKLNQIISAEFESGLYHDNIILILELYSPYYKSKREIERFEMIVMTHKDDGAITLAIDEFPEMDEDAIEQYQIVKIEQKRKERKEAIKQLEFESLFYNNNEFTLKENFKSKLDLNDNSKSIKNILNEFDSKELKDYLNNYSKLLQPKLPKEQLNEELSLIGLSLSELYDIYIGSIDNITDFQIYRSEQMLNNALQYIEKSNKKHSISDEL